MKKKFSKAMLSLLLVLALLIGGASGALAAGETLADVFPDAAFRAIIKTKVLGNAAISDSALYSTYADDFENYNPMFSGNGDVMDLTKIGLGKSDEDDMLKGLDVSDKGIKSLKGIERLVNLMALDCEGNQLESLDLSKNTMLMFINCDGNQLKSLLTPLDATSALASMSGMKNLLAAFSCRNNQLTSLNVTKNINLVYLNCIDNQLTTLDLSKCSKMVTLGIQSNKLTSVNFNSSAKIKRMAAGDNQLCALNPTLDPSVTDKDILLGEQTIAIAGASESVTLSGLTKANVQNLVGATTTDYKTFKPTASSFSYDYVVGPSVMKVTVKLGNAPFVLIGDINKDGSVNAQDLSLLLKNYGKTGKNDSDINGDNNVNAQDLSALLNNYGMHY